MTILQLLDCPVGAVRLGVRASERVYGSQDDSGTLFVKMKTSGLLVDVHHLGSHARKTTYRNQLPSQSVGATQQRAFSEPRLQPSFITQRSAIRTVSKLTPSP